jgi:biopolymer transport protein ExbD
MSHGGGGGEEGLPEINLTPLLDLVLQLVMFFMLVTKFVNDELDERIKLPVASQAKPLTSKDTNFIYLNVDKTGRVLRTIGEPMMTSGEVRSYLDVMARNFSQGEKKAKEEVTIIIRADKDAKFIHIHQTMMAIKAAGFKKLQLRAQVKDAT